MPYCKLKYAAKFPSFSEVKLTLFGQKRFVTKFRGDRKEFKSFIILYRHRWECSAYSNTYSDSHCMPALLCLQSISRSSIFYWCNFCSLFHREVYLMWILVIKVRRILLCHQLMASETHLISLKMAYSSKIDKIYW